MHSFSHRFSTPRICAVDRCQVARNFRGSTQCDGPPEVQKRTHAFHSANAQLVAIDPDTLAKEFMPLEQADEAAFDDAGDKGMHGVDWKADFAKYAPLVDRVTARDELNHTLADMMSELSALHTSVQPGDIRRATSS